MEGEGGGCGGGGGVRVIRGQGGEGVAYYGAVETRGKRREVSWKGFE